MSRSQIAVGDTAYCAVAEFYEGDDWTVGAGMSSDFEDTLDEALIQLGGMIEYYTNGAGRGPGFGIFFIEQYDESVEDRPWMSHIHIDSWLGDST